MTLFESLTIREGWETKRWRGGKGEERDGEGYREREGRTGVKRWKDEVERKETCLVFPLRALIFSLLATDRCHLKLQ